jgi:hypothetical protein
MPAAAIAAPDGYRVAVLVLEEESRFERNCMVERILRPSEPAGQSRGRQYACTTTDVVASVCGRTRTTVPLTRSCAHQA